MNLKAILFDLDDTLYDGFIPGDREGFSRCGQYAAEHLGIPAETFSDAMLRARQAAFRTAEKGFHARRERHIRMHKYA